MVRIINYVKRVTEDGRAFFVLEISGGLEMVKSQTTLQYYATEKKASIPSTFDEKTCNALVGTEMPGNVIKEACEPYEYLNKESGQLVTLHHRYVYIPEEAVVSEEDKSIERLLAEVNSFPTNGQHKEEFAL